MCTRIYSLFEVNGKQNNRNFYPRSLIINPIVQYRREPNVLFCIAFFITLDICIPYQILPRINYKFIVCLRIAFRGYFIFIVLEEQCIACHRYRAHYFLRYSGSKGMVATAQGSTKYDRQSGCRKPHWLRFIRLSENC